MTILSRACLHLFTLLAAQLAFLSSSMAMQGERVGDGDETAKSIVLILVENKHTCSGVVFSKNRILTAAHCVIRHGKKKFPAKSVKVFFTKNLYADPHVSSNVIKITTYPGYVKQNRDRDGRTPATSEVADVAVLKLLEPHPPRAKEVIITDGDEDMVTSIRGQLSNSSASSVVAYGFGPESRRYYGVLQRARLTVDSIFPFNGSGVSQRLVAVRNRDGRQVGVCGGDSGGGVFFVDEKTGEVRKRNGSPILAGIIFAKAGLGRCSGTERMLKAESFLRWLNSH